MDFICENFYIIGDILDFEKLNKAKNSSSVYARY